MKKKIEMNIDWNNRVKIGNLTLYPCADYPDGSKSVWIEQDNGEGGQFPQNEIARFLRKFYDEHF